MGVVYWDWIGKQILFFAKDVMLLALHYNDIFLNYEAAIGAGLYRALAGFMI